MGATQKKTKQAKQLTKIHNKQSHFSIQYLHPPYMKMSLLELHTMTEKSQQHYF